MHPILPASPYNHSKLVAEDICGYYNQTFNIPIAILRPVNIYGPGQNSNFLIPEIIQQVLDKSKDYVEVMDLRPKRDYLYVDNFIDALIATLDIADFGVFNIGCGYSVSVEEIIKTVMKVTNISKPIHSKNIERKNEVWDVYMNIQKFKDTFHWEPKTSFVEGLSKVINAK
jgi:nucleoside-diphosphate-sugar epimerase